MHLNFPTAIKPTFNIYLQFQPCSNKVSIKKQINIKRFICHNDRHSTDRTPIHFATQFTAWIDSSRLERDRNRFEFALTHFCVYGPVLFVPIGDN